LRGAGKVCTLADLPLVVVAYWALGMAIALGDGNLTGLPFALASFALLAVRWTWAGPQGKWLVPLVVASTAAIALGHNDAERSLHGWIVPLTTALAAIALGGYARPSLAGAPALGVALALYAAAGAATILTAPVPYIDVLELQQDGAAALEAGRNPYAVTYPNRYTPADTRAFFGDDRAELEEYPYPPASLLVTALSHRLAGDVRWAELAAQLGIGALLFALARGAGLEPPVALGLATLHLVHTRGLFVLGRGWTDPAMACALLGVLLAIQRGWTRWLGLVLGAFVAMKQHSVLALPLLARGAAVPRRTWLEALTVAAAVTLPFVLWGPADFVNDVLLFQLRQPFRAEAMSLPAAVFGLTGWRAPGVVALAGAAAATACVWRRLAPRAPGLLAWRLPAALAIVYMAFFLCAKQAFCNYYYFAGTLLLATVAAGG
jgi:hypothetical protein